MSMTITVRAMDDAGNSASDSATVELRNTLTFKSMIPDGITIFHVPLDDPDIQNIGQLRAELGDAVTSIIVGSETSGTGFDTADDSMEITADLGIVLVMNDERGNRL